MYSITVTTAPSVEPVTVEEAKVFCRIDISDDDALITSLIKAAREASERYTGRAYINQTITLVGNGQDRLLTLPRPPQSAISTVKYLDSANAWQTMTLNTDYKVISVGNAKAIYLETLPYINADSQFTLEVVYTAGYGSTAASVPEPLKQAVLQRVAAMYEHRGDGIVNNAAAKALEGPFRKVLP